MAISGSVFPMAARRRISSFRGLTVGHVAAVFENPHSRRASRNAVVPIRHMARRCQRDGNTDADVANEQTPGGSPRTFDGTLKPRRRPCSSASRMISPWRSRHGITRRRSSHANGALVRWPARWLLETLPIRPVIVEFDQTGTWLTKPEAVDQRDAVKPELARSSDGDFKKVGSGPAAHGRAIILLNDAMQWHPRRCRQPGLCASATTPHKTARHLCATGCEIAEAVAASCSIRSRQRISIWSRNAAIQTISVSRSARPMSNCSEYRAST